MKLKNSDLIVTGQTHAKNGSGDISTNNFADIIPVVSGQIGGHETNIVSAKALHKALGVGRDFTNWIKGRIDEYEFTDSVDYVSFDSPILANQSTNVDQIQTTNGGWVTKRGGDRRSKDFGLSLGMAKELSMVERNEQGRAVRRYFIQCEERLQTVTPGDVKIFRDQLKARITAANYFKPMCSALELSRAEQGKPTAAHHYTTESNMLARIVLGGLTSKQWATANGVSGEPRNSMSTSQLEHLSYLEQTNITLIELGWHYQQRKDELTRLSQRHLAKRLEAAHE